ncbi:MAG: hypothetical protein AAB728_05920, partial [Patescibacteria group bacterium]
GSKILSEEVFPRFTEQLQKAILDNIDVFKSVLAQSESSFLNEAGSEELEYERVKKIWEDKQREVHTA